MGDERADSTADEAAFYRTALYLGLVRGEMVVAWADARLTESTTPGPALIGLAMIPYTDGIPSLIGGAHRAGSGRRACVLEPG